MEYFFEMLIAERGATENTISSYKKDIKDLFDYLESNHIVLEKVTSFIVKNFIAELSKKNLGAKTIGRKISALRQFFTFLVSDRILKENPTLNIIMPKRRFLSCRQDSVSQSLSTLFRRISGSDRQCSCCCCRFRQPGGHITSCA